MEVNILDNREKLILNLIREFSIVDGRTRIQKLFYLLKKKYDSPIPFNCVNYHYGPYSEELQEVLHKLVGKNMVEETISTETPGYLYKLTDLSKSLFKVCLLEVPQQISEAIVKLKKEGYQWKELKDILLEVYEIAGIKT